MGIDLISGNHTPNVVKYHIDNMFTQTFKVSEAEACSMAAAFWNEFSPYLMPTAKPQSAQFLRMATRLAKTGHESRFVQGFADYGLAVDIPYSYIDVGLKVMHPVLSISDTVSALNKNGKLDLLFQGNGHAEFENFWGKWKKLEPDHPIFKTHKGREQNCVPIAVHFDEGQTLKKKSIMVMQYQPVLGKGTRKRKSTLVEPGCNMLGNSLTNRILWGVMLSRVYSGKKHGNKPLKKLIRRLSTELSDAFYKGFKLWNDETIFLIPLFMKGDWPALAKVGNLSRHFGRQMKSGATGGQGICHLCQADREGFPDWHDVSWGNMCKMHDGSPPPWTVEPALVTAVPLPESYKARFFRIDIFHCLHKGFLGDIAANTIDTRSQSKFLTHVVLTCIYLFKDLSFDLSWHVHNPSPSGTWEVCCFEDEVFGEGAFDHLCDVCFTELKEFCTKESMSLHMTGLTRTLLGYMKSSQYPTGTLIWFSLVSKK